jgi:hypothetical protein
MPREQIKNIDLAPPRAENGAGYGCRKKLQSGRLF